MFRSAERTHTANKKLYKTTPARWNEEPERITLYAENTARITLAQPRVAGDGTGVEQAARENQRRRERGGGEMAMPYQKLPHRETSTKKLSSVPPRGRAKGRVDHAVKDTMRSIGRLRASYFSLQFFPLFFALFQRRSSFGADSGSGQGRRENALVTYRRKLSSFVTAPAKVEFSQREECREGGLSLRTRLHTYVVPDVSGVRGCGIRAFLFPPIIG